MFGNFSSWQSNLHVCKNTGLISNIKTTKDGVLPTQRFSTNKVSIVLLEVGSWKAEGAKKDI